MMRESIQILAAVLLATGCEKNTEDVEVEVVGAHPPGAGGAGGGGVPASAFDLEATASLIRDGGVHDADALEAALNAGDHEVDVNGDGKRDRLEVVDDVDGSAHTFTVRALPDAVAIATIELVPAGSIGHVTVRYAPIVIVEVPVVITFDVQLVVTIEEHRVHGKHKKHKKH